MSVQATLDVKLRILATNPGDVSTPQDVFYLPLLLKLLDGSGAAQVNKSWHDRLTVNAGANQDIDLNGTLENALGQTVNFSKIKVLVIYNRNGTANDKLVVGGHPTAAWEAWTDDAGSTVIVSSAGLFVYFAPNTDAPSVTAATDDILRIHNPGAESVEFDIAIAGV